MKTLLIMGMLSLGLSFAQVVVNTSAPDGQGKITVSYQNVSTSPLVASAITWIVPDSSGPGHRGWVVYKDSLIDDNFPPIAPGGSTKLTVGGGNPASQASLRAAIFQDASVFGDADWVQMILKRRSHYAEALGYVLADLAGALQTISDSGSAIQLLQTLQASRISAVPKTAYVVHQLFVEPTQDVKEANLAALALDDQAACIRIAYGPLLHNLTKSQSVQHSIQVFSTNYSLKKSQLLSAKPPIAP
jgi:hypothetical protein